MASFDELLRQKRRMAFYAMTARGGNWNPRKLFRANEQGAWYDPSDFSTMFQDSAGTTPVTAVGQSVGRILDKSGRGNHAVQSGVNTLKPVLQQDATGRYFLLFDGIDDFLVTDTITPGLNKSQVFAGVRKLSDAAAGIVAETNVSSNNIGTLALFAPYTAGANYGFRTFGTAQSNSTSANSYASPLTSVITGLGDIATDTAILRVNGVQAASSATDQGSGNYLANPMYIGRRGGASLPFNGRLYGLIVRFGVNLSDAQIAQTENWLNQKTGAY